MPTYEYICKKCVQKFEITMSLSEKEKGKNPDCPYCGSEEVIQVLGNFAILSGQTNKRSTSPVVCGPSCGPNGCG